MATAVISDPALMTAGQLFALPDDDFQYEIDEGVLIMMAPAGGAHGRAELKLAVKLFNIVEDNDLGEVHPSDTGFLLSLAPDTLRAPDIAFVRRDRLPLPTHDVQGEGYLVGAPDLAVEVQSAHQSPADLRRKVKQYLAAGTQSVWVLLRRRRIAEIYESGAEPRTIDENGFLEASVLPDVRIRLGDILQPR